MAGLSKHPNSPFWTAIFYDGSGAKVRRSTKERDRRKAIKTAIAWEDLAKAGREKRLTEAQVRKVSADILTHYTGETLHHYTCRAWMEEWLAGKRGALTEQSVQKYTQVTGDFLTHLGERAELTLAAISTKDLRSFRDAMAKRFLSPSTVNQSIRKVLSAPFLAAMRLGYISMNPCASVEELRDEADAEREVFSAEQIQAIVSAAEGAWKGATLCGYYTGLRLRDVAELCWGAIDFKTGLLSVKTRKTGAKLAIPLHDDFKAWLHTEPRGIGKAPIFPSLTGLTTGGRKGLSAQFKAIMERAGIKGRILRGSDGNGRVTTSLSFHCLRHSFVSVLANAGVAPEVRRKLSGHADERSHDKYTHHEMDTMRSAMAKIPSLGA